MKPLTLGQRVRVRGTTNRGVVDAYPEGTYVHVKMDGGSFKSIHRESLISLKPGPKLREFWIKITGSYPAICDQKPKDPENYIHVKEVRK